MTSDGKDLWDGPFQRRGTMKTYLDNLKHIRKVGHEMNLPEFHVESLMDQYFQNPKREGSANARKNTILLGYLSKSLQNLYSLIRKVSLLFICLLLTMVILYSILQNKPIQYFLQSKLQDFIYPGMKILRKLFLPVISIFPSLTNFYDESCLVTNPFFRVPNMPCPCENVRAVLNLTGEDTKKAEFHPGIPFVIKIERNEVDWQKLKALYDRHRTIFDRDASNLLISSSSLPSSNTGEWSNPSSFFESSLDFRDKKSINTHAVWRCNRMEPTRLLRAEFGAPVGEPYYATGVAIEKLVIIDGFKAPSYRLPVTDGTTVFIQQSSGSRMILLTPANECKEKCSTLSIVLPPSHVLWFSWWYWRASSLPSPTAKSLSVTYVGSYL